MSTLLVFYLKIPKLEHSDYQVLSGLWKICK